jgi:hypothetical protein
LLDVARDVGVCREPDAGVGPDMADVSGHTAKQVIDWAKMELEGIRR